MNDYLLWIDIIYDMNLQKRSKTKMPKKSFTKLCKNLVFDFSEISFSSLQEYNINLY